MEGILKDNQYPFGGLFPINIPAVLSGVGKKLRDRMYRTVRPESYSKEQLGNFIMGKSREAYRDPNSEALLGKYTGQDSIIADYTQAPDGLPIGRVLTQAEIDSLGANNNTLAKYAVNNIIVPSKSKRGAFEFAYPNQSGNAPHLPYNYNDIPSSRWTHSKQLGSYEQSKEKEGNRYSITYKDVWDINPFRGKSYNDDPTWQSFIEAGKAVGLDKLGDIVPFGKPFDMHGKQYYNRNGKPVKSKSEGGFIYKPRDAWDNLSMLEKSEMMKVAVRNGITDLKTIREKYNEFAEGGKIYIKPSHRGRLTELKARTGKTEAELYNDGNPAHRKMIVFARNARKWHGEGGNLFNWKHGISTEPANINLENNFDFLNIALTRKSKR